MRNSAFCTWVVVMLVLAEVVLVLLSWLLSATMTEGVRSLLTGEGIRWFFAHFVDTLGSPLLVWLLLLAVAGGCVWKSRLLNDGGNYRRAAGKRVALLLLLVAVGCVLLLVAVPHAVLLSATGCWWPSPFSRSLVPTTCFVAIVCSTGYGLVARTFTSLSQVVDACVEGVRQAAPLFFVYILLMQFCASFRYVFL